MEGREEGRIGCGHPRSDRRSDPSIRASPAPESERARASVWSFEVETVLSAGEMVRGDGSEGGGWMEKQKYEEVDVDDWSSKDRRWRGGGLVAPTVGGGAEGQRKKQGSAKCPPPHPLFPPVTLRPHFDKPGLCVSGFASGLGLGLGLAQAGGSRLGVYARAGGMSLHTTAGCARRCGRV